MITVSGSPNFPGEDRANTTTRVPSWAEIVRRNSGGTVDAVDPPPYESTNETLTVPSLVITSTPPPQLLEGLEAWVAELVDAANQPPLNKDVSLEELAEIVTKTPPSSKSSLLVSDQKDVLEEVAEIVNHMDGGSLVVVVSDQECVGLNVQNKQDVPIAQKRQDDSHPRLPHTMGDQFVQRMGGNIRPNVYGPNHINYGHVHGPPFWSTPSPRSAHRPPYRGQGTGYITPPTHKFMYHPPPPVILMRPPDFTWMEHVPFDYRGMPFRPPPCHLPPTSMYYPTSVHTLVPNDPKPSMIVTQIDYYFSEDNLVKDVFLKSKMDSEGWVPLSLIASFPRVKQLTKSIPFMAKCLRSSNVVQIQGNRMRKRDNWKKWIPHSSAISNVECSNDKPASSSEDMINSLSNASPSPCICANEQNEGNSG